MHEFQRALDNMAERSKAVRSGRIPKGRGFESHCCQPNILTFSGMRMQQDLKIAAGSGSGESESWSGALCKDVKGMVKLVASKDYS